MKLAIEIIKRQGISYYSLVDQEQADRSDNLITSTELVKMKTLKWYLPLKSTDVDSILDNCTANQQIVAMYFYIDNITTSETLMNQWFNDTGCSPELSENLSRLVYTARIAKSDGDSESIADEIFESLNQAINHTITNAQHSKITQLSDILLLMKSSEPIQWDFDSLSSNPTDGYRYIDLSRVVESSFVVEDHHSIINGFSVKYTAFLETVAGRNTSLLKNLCSYIPLGMRDKVSLGRAILNDPVIIQKLLLEGYSAVKLFGLDSDGKLKEYSVGFEIRNICFSIPGSYDQLLPLFIKFIKNPLVQKNKIIIQ